VTSPLRWDALSQLPAGLTLITDNRWTRLDEPGWGVVNNPTADLAIVTDTTAPDGDPSVLSQVWAGVADGYNPDYAWVGFSSRQELYGAFIVKFSANWRSEGVKWLIAEAGGSPNSELPFWLGLGPYQVALPPGGLDPVLGFTTNGGASNYPYDDSQPGWFGPTYLAPRRLPRGVWCKVQFHVSSNPDRARVWIDDVLIFDSNLEPRPGFTFAWSWGSQVFNGLQLGATWGGGNSASPPPGATISYARTVLYGR